MGGSAGLIGGDLCEVLGQDSCAPGSCPGDLARLRLL